MPAHEFELFGVREAKRLWQVSHAHARYERTADTLYGLIHNKVKHDKNGKKIRSNVTVHC